MWHASIPKIANDSTIPNIAPWKSRLGRLASLRRRPIDPTAGGLAVGGGGSKWQVFHEQTRIRNDKSWSETRWRGG